MEILIAKILAAGFIVALSLLFGFLPKMSTRRFDFTSIDTTDPKELKKERKKMKNMFLSFLLNLGGGVLIANCFCHWLPEVREGLHGHKDLDTFLPMAEVIMCVGFFLICGLEELLHHFLHPHQTKEKDLQLQINSNNNNSNNNGIKKGTDSEDVESEKTATQVKAAIRTVFVVSAMSFHSIIEGLALSLESETEGIWLNMGATALHKFVISFSVGVELISNKVSFMVYSISIIVFSVAPAAGSVIGIVLTELSFDSEEIDLPLQILQGIATGTVVYVVFFEIIPKAKSVGGTGKQHILAMVIGFCIFLPSLYFHSEHEESPKDAPICKNITSA